jgi:hypothetical protein
MTGDSKGRSLLSDSTAPMAFCAVGAGQTLLDYLQARLIVTREVLGELKRNHASMPSLAVAIAWLEDDEEERVHDLTSAHALEVTDFLQNYRTELDHPNEHLGEVATVYGALELVDQGRRPLVCMDDQLGKSLCRAKNLDHADTPALLIEMVCAKAIDFRLGQRIWQHMFSERRLWRAYKERVEAACKEALP